MRIHWKRAAVWDSGTLQSEGAGYDAFDEEIKLYRDAVNAENEYIKEYNAGLMDCAEVQIVSSSNCCQDRFIQEEVKFLNAVIQNNYRMDEDNQLWFVSSSEDFVLFTHKRDEDEIRTAEELDAIWDAKLEELYGDESAD